jgi:hypothetical protein
MIEDITTSSVANNHRREPSWRRPSRRRVLIGTAGAALSIGSVIGVINLATGSSPFVDRGDYPTVSSLQGGQITISPPPAGSSGQFMRTAQDVYNSFESISPAAPIARELGYGPAQIYRATYTDRGMGAVDPSTRHITPDFNGSTVYVLMYRDVAWPVSPAAPQGNRTATSHLSGPEDVIAIFDRSGQCLDTMVTPAT